MNALPESRTTIKHGEDPPKEPGVLRTCHQDVLDCSTVWVDRVMSDSSPSSMGPPGSVPAPMTTLVQDSQPRQVSSGNSHLPPPPPAEPYESFLHRTGRPHPSPMDSGAVTTHDVVVLPFPSSMTSRWFFLPFPVPVHRYEGPSDVGHMQRSTSAPPGNRMQAHRHKYVALLPAWI